MNHVLSPEALGPEPLRDSPPGFLIRAVLGLRRALLGLANRLVPPEMVLFEHSAAMAGSILLGAVARFAIADALGDEALTAAELAIRTGTNPDALHRTLRALATNGVFSLGPDGRFRNNRLSFPLRSDRWQRTGQWVRYFTSGSNLAAWADFDRTLASGDGAFARVHGQSVWAHFDSHPDERELFAEAMMFLTLNEAPILAGLYPFAGIARLCDVGGGRGTLLSELLVRNPRLEGVLYENAGVLESAERLLASRGVSHRARLVAGSFFDEVPEGCDAYLLKNILHDWDDETCLRILRNCRRAMAAGSRLLLVEAVTEPCSVKGLGPLSDIQMMVVCDNGRERSRAEFARLLEASGFALQAVRESPTLSLLEARPA